MGENIYTGPVARVPWPQIAGCAVLVVLFIFTGFQIMVPANRTTEGMQTVALVLVYLAGFIGAAVLWWCSVSRRQTSREKAAAAERQAYIEGALPLDLLVYLYDTMAAQNGGYTAGSWNGGGTLQPHIFFMALKGILQEHSVQAIEAAARNGTLSSMTQGRFNGAGYQRPNGVQPPQQAANTT